MPNGHLVTKLKKLLDDVDIRLFQSKTILRDADGKVSECRGWYDGDKGVDLALKGHDSAEELIHTVIHELVHMAGYNEEAVDKGLDNAAYQSRALREKVAIELLNTFLK
jgi:hypothetical protein